MSFVMFFPFCFLLILFYYILKLRSMSIRFYGFILLPTLNTRMFCIDSRGGSGVCDGEATVTSVFFSTLKLIARLEEVLCCPDRRKEFHPALFLRR